MTKETEKKLETLIANLVSEITEAKVTINKLEAEVDILKAECEKHSKRIKDIEAVDKMLLDNVTKIRSEKTPEQKESEESLNSFIDELCKEFFRKNCNSKQIKIAVIRG